MYISCMNSSRSSGILMNLCADSGIEPVHRRTPPHEFFREWIMESSGGRVDKSALYYAYVNEMRDSGYHPKGRSNFNLALRQAFPDLQEERLRSHGRDLLIWRGIVLKEGAKTWSPSIR